MRLPAAPLGVAALGAGGCLALLAVDPADGGWPACPTKALLGVSCPLCGGLRASRAVLTGDLAGAAGHNLLVTLALPVVVVLWVRWLLATVRPAAPSPPG